MSTPNNKDTIAQAVSEIHGSTAYKRLSTLFDDGIFTEIDAFAKSSDTFAEAVAGYGTVNGSPAYAFAQNGDFAGGAMSSAQSAKIKKVYDLAVKTGAPVIGLYDSSGARLNQGADMLAGYGNMLNSISNLSGVVPQISLVLGPCFGAGALNAANADIIIMSKNARLGISTNGKGGSIEDAVSSGLVSVSAESDEDAINKARLLMTYLPSNNLSMPPVSDSAEPDAASNDPVSLSFDGGSVFELKPEYGRNVKTGFARLYGSAVAFVSTNGDTLDCESAQKAAEFVKLCDAFAIPVVTFADSKGFKSLKPAAMLAAAYAQATTVKIAVVTGEAYGPLYIALAGTAADSDITFAWSNSSIAPLPPLTGANILWADKMAVPYEQQEAVVEQFKSEMCNAFEAAANGFVQDIIEPKDTRAKLFACLDMLSGKRVSSLPKKHSTH